MKKLLVVIMLIGASNCLLAQSQGYIIADGDTAIVNVLLKKNSSGNKVFFNHAYEEEMHEVTAPNAQEAYMPGKPLYISVKLPSTKNYIWVECFFDGVYKLIKHKSDFFIIKPSEIIKLEHPEDKKGRRKFIGQLILLFHKDIEFDSSQTDYDPKSLVKPLILMHETKGLPYRDYNKYVTRTSETLLEGVFGLTNCNLNLYPLNNSEISGLSYSIGINRHITYPDFSKRITLSVGAKLSACQFDEYIKASHGGINTFVDFNSQFFSAGVRGGVYFHVIELPTLKLLLGIGVEATGMISPNREIRVETVAENVVQTKFTVVPADHRLLLQQYDQVVISLPKFSNSFQLGLGGSFPLNKSFSDLYKYGLSRSLLFSIFYKL